MYKSKVIYLEQFKIYQIKTKHIYTSADINRLMWVIAILQNFLRNGATLGTGDDREVALILNYILIPFD